VSHAPLLLHRAHRAAILWGVTLTHCACASPPFIQSDISARARFRHTFAASRISSARSPWSMPRESQHAFSELLRTHAVRRTATALQIEHAPCHVPSPMSSPTRATNAHPLNQRPAAIAGSACHLATPPHPDARAMPAPRSNGGAPSVISPRVHAASYHHCHVIIAQRVSNAADVGASGKERARRSLNNDAHMSLSSSPQTQYNAGLGMPRS